jgi:hypothetical protein
MYELLESAWKSIDQLRRGRYKDSPLTHVVPRSSDSGNVARLLFASRLWLGEGPYCKGGSFYFTPMLRLDTSDPQQLRRDIPQTVSGPQCCRCVDTTDMDGKEIWLLRILQIPTKHSKSKMPISTRRQRLPRDPFDRKHWNVFLVFSSSFPHIEELGAREEIARESLDWIKCDFACRQADFWSILRPAWGSWALRIFRFWSYSLQPVSLLLPQLMPSPTSCPSHFPRGLDTRT